MNKNAQGTPFAQSAWSESVDICWDEVKVPITVTQSGNMGVFNPMEQIH